MAPMVMCYAGVSGEVNSQVLAHFESAARGGVGLIVVEASYVHPSGKGFESEIAMNDDSLISLLRMLTSTVKVHNCAIAAQLYHGGIQAKANVPVGPSPVGRKIFRPANTPRELSTSEVEEMVEHFVNAAVRAKSAGFDMVEIHGTHGYLISQFLSPLTNKRTDKYGTDKTLFATEIIEGIKRKCGSDYPVIFRLSTCEYEEGGITLDDAKAFAAKLEKLGVDALHVTAGTYDTADHIIPPAYYDEQGYFFDRASEIKKVVNIPIISGGMIYEPEIAEKAICNNTVDFVFLGRQIIADPEWPNKTKNGKTDQIRPCIACEECIERIFFQEPVNCSVNPLKSFEYRYLNENFVEKTKEPKKIAIVGGGVAGLEAARIATLKGHKVALFEKSDTLGGVLKIVFDRKPRLKRLIEYYQTTLKNLNVDIRYGVKADFETVIKEDPDIVIIASGAEPLIPQINGAQTAILAEDILAGKASTQEEVLIIGAGLVGCELALKLSEEGKKITLVEALPEIAPAEVTLNKLALTKLLNEANVKTHTNTTVTEIQNNTATVKDNNGNSQKIEAKTVVLAVGRKSVVDQDLVNALKASGKEVHIIGDAKQAKKIIQAVQAGFWTTAPT
jgi:2,4-dienoyl-CoA reductase-like NADH-dependent reductase (Old Yellow Enzyme family)